MIGLLRDDDGRVRGVECQDAAGRESRSRRGLTVGADGIRSARRPRDRGAVPAAGARRRAPSSTATSTACRRRLRVGVRRRRGRRADPHQRRARPASSSATTPAADATTAPAGARARPSPPCSTLRRARLAERASRAPRRGRSLHGWGGIPGHVRQLVGPGWALVGDAGYFKDPITTHGMTDALRDAELLSDAVLEVLGGASPEPIALAAYQDTRDRLSSALVRRDRGGRALRLGRATGSGALLRAVSSAMSDEVDHLSARPDRRVSTPCEPRSSSRLTTSCRALVACRAPRGDQQATGGCRDERPAAGFSVASSVAATASRSRRTPGRAGRPRQLVKVLALARDRRLHREQVIDALWPGLSRRRPPAPRLHKAAHYARRALGDAGRRRAAQRHGRAVPARDDVEVDVRRVRRAAAARPCEAGDAELAAEALRVVRRSAAARRPLRAVGRRAATGRRASSTSTCCACSAAGTTCWPRTRPTRTAHLALARAHAAGGDVRGALRPVRAARAGAAPRARRHARARRPSGCARELERSTPATEGRPPASPRPDDGAAARLFGRREVGDQIRDVLRRGRPRAGHHPAGRPGPPGVGQVRRARPGRGAGPPSGTGGSARGAASSVEGPWPYAPVLEAFSDLCRRHPALLDGLDDDFRAEIEQALSGRTSAGPASPATSGCSSPRPS